jgi:hypothetical protein
MNVESRISQLERAADVRSGEMWVASQDFDDADLFCVHRVGGSGGGRPMRRAELAALPGVLIVVEYVHDLGRQDDYREGGGDAKAEAWA